MSVFNKNKNHKIRKKTTQQLISDRKIFEYNKPTDYSSYLKNPEDCLSFMGNSKYRRFNRIIRM